MAEGPNPKVARVLREISLLLQLKGENAFKSRAYDVAADRVLGLTEDLDAIVARGGLEELPGIGKALAQKISELVTTGALGYYENLKAEFPAGILDLLKVPDLGPKKAMAVYRELGVGSLEQLEVACREGRVRALRGFGQKTEEKILAGLDLLKRSSGRHRLGDVLPIAEELLAFVKGLPGVTRASVGGSVRRFCETVADADLVCAAGEAAPVLEAFSRHPDVAQVLGQGESKCSVRLRDRDLQVDLRVLPDADFATALHHFTGSKAHHIRLRGLAQERGLKISEWGVHRGEEKLPVPDEQALYALLNMQFVPPELREGAGEVEAALASGVPQDLISDGDLQGAVHNHTTWSDGRNSLEEMAVGARELGFKYLTVTEHSQSAGYAGGLSIDDLRRQWDEIDRVNEKVPGIRLLKGAEVDILESGGLDYPDGILEKMDVVIASIHARYHMDEEQITQRVLRAFENPLVHIFGHPTGRLINARAPSPMNMDRVLDAAAERGVIVEVNGNPERLDLKWEYVRQAISRGVKLVASADAHSVADLRRARYAVATARKGWARRADILNTLPVEGFLSALAGRRHPGPAPRPVV